MRHGHEITLFSYAPQALPAGVSSADAAVILPRDQFFAIGVGPHRGTIAQFSDRFRYHMIRRTGLVWVDTDIYCLSADWPGVPVLIGREDDSLVNGAVLGLPRDHAFLDDAIAVADALRDRPIWAYTGPHLVTALVHQHELRSQVQEPKVFYPLHWPQAAELFRPRPGIGALSWAEGTVAVHFWNELLRINGYDKAAGPRPDSIMGILFAEAGYASSGTSQ
ncbi:MAG: hypothetical protein JOY99_00170 [Sphingomonadaceae bacterium]|nr:hypothetical protein [Sphingomonadaceae bacterium]